MIGIAAVILGGGLALASVAAWIMGHAVLLLTCLGVFVLVLGGFCVWSAWITSPARREAQRQTEQRRQLLETLPPARDIPADQMPMPKRATWPRIDTGYAAATRQPSPKKDAAAKSQERGVTNGGHRNVRRPRCGVPGVPR